MAYQSRKSNLDRMAYHKPFATGGGLARMSFFGGLKSIKSKPPISAREWGFAAGLEKRENLQLTKHSP